MSWLVFFSFSFVTLASLMRPLEGIWCLIFDWVPAELVVCLAPPAACEIAAPFCLPFRKYCSVNAILQVMNRQVLNDIYARSANCSSVLPFSIAAVA